MAITFAIFWQILDLFGINGQPIIPFCSMWQHFTFSMSFIVMSPSTWELLASIQIELLNSDYSHIFILLAFSTVAFFRRLDKEGTKESSLLTNLSSLGKKAIVENARRINISL